MFLEKFSTGFFARKAMISNISSPLGVMVALADDDYVYLLQFNDGKDNLDLKVERICTPLQFKLTEGRNKLLDKLQYELDQYFDGNLQKFTVPIQSFGTQFHKEVWRELINIPFGTTKSYSDLARALGRGAGYARAVGTACGANPHVILVPCHRIVARGGKGGYSAGGERKDWLLAHEEKYACI